jgi:hypothetical protein
MAILDDLRKRGYTDVRPLEKLVYTDGKTYEFPQGMYFACHAETDTESTVFNSDLKKLGRKQDGIVGLIIENATSHDPSEWSVRRAKSNRTNVSKLFNTKKIRAALRASDSGIQITEFCGIVPAFKYDPPSSFVSHYEIEMKEMRDRLVSANKIEIENLKEAWLEIKYPNGGLGGRKNEWTAAHHKVVAMYDMRNTDGAIRKRHSKNILGANTSTLCGMVGGNLVHVGIQRYRAYMWTFMEHKKRRHQNIVDHIDGDRSNNAPWNLRWVSAAENQLVRHTATTEYVVTDMVALHEMHGAPLDPKTWHGWTFHSNMWITRPGKSKFVARSTTDTYPTIFASLENKNGEIKKYNIKCHLIVAFLHRIPTSDRASDHLESLKKSRDHFHTFEGTNFEYAKELKSCALVIMHDDNDKSNYSFENLTIGTPSENAYARHATPETTLRKRVDIIDTTTRKRIRTFDSQIKAAEWLGVHKQTISDAVRFNRTREIGSYCTTTHKLTGATYYVVDASQE